MSLLKCVTYSVIFLALYTSIGFTQSGIITTYVGPGLPVNGESAISQPIDYPAAVALDGSGGFYMASRTQNRVYRVDANGKIDLTAGNGIPGYSGDGRSATSAQLKRPVSVAVDGKGNVYIADGSNCRVRKVTPGGVISTIAGIGTWGYSGDGGPATAAELNNPAGVAVDSEGNIFIADSGNHRIRKVTAAGIISTVAGNGMLGYSGDGEAAIAAQLNSGGVAVDTTGNLFIADNLNNRVRKVTLNGVIETVAGNGTSGYYGDGGVAIAAQLSGPNGLAFDSAGNLYIADYMNNRIRKVTLDGVINTVAGNGMSGYSGDGGPATEAQLQNPAGVAVDTVGNFYIVDAWNNRIRKVMLDGVINTVAGNGTSGYSGDGGPTTAAKLKNPNGIAVDTVGNLYIADYLNNRVRKVTVDGVINTVAGNGTSGYSGDGGLATAAGLAPQDVTVDIAGNLYIADYLNNRVRKVTLDGAINTVAGNGTSGYSGDGGQATTANLKNPNGVAVDTAGNLYISDSNNYRIRKVSPDGVINTVAGNGTSGYSGDGGQATTAQIGVSLFGPKGLAVDTAGNLYIADYLNNRVRKVTPAGVISTVAGNGMNTGVPDFIAGNGTTGNSGDGGPATEAEVVMPNSVTIDAAGNLFITELTHCRIRKVTPAGVISTVAGNGMFGYSGDNGSATEAQLYLPFSVAVDSAGNLFIGDNINNRIRKVSSILDCSSLAVSSGGAAACQTAGTNAAARAGYAKLAVNSGAAPYGTAIFSFKQNGMTVTEAGIPASPPTTNARIFIDYRAMVNAIPGRSDSGTIDVNTGVGIVNYGSATANVVYTLRNLNGDTLAIGNGTLAVGKHLSCFINQLKKTAASDFNLPSNFQSDIQFGTLEIASDQSLSVVALRGINNQRKEFLFTTTPIADLTKPLSSDSIYFPQFADGGGYTTSLVLLNTSSQAETGTLQILDNSGVPLTVHQVGGTTNSSFQYSIPAGGAFHFQSDGFSVSTTVGWARLIPDSGTMTPIGSGVFTYNPAGILVSESGIPSAVPTTHARVYVDMSENHNTGLAVANVGSAAASITVNAFQMDGVSEAGTSWGPLPLAGYGHDSKFADQFIEGLPEGFRGVLDISSATPFAALTVRSLYNERHDFLMTTFPIADANQVALSPIVFPQVADGGGYVSEFILIGAGSAAKTTPGFYDETGAPTGFSH